MLQLADAIKYLVMFMTVVHTYFYAVVDTQRACHTLKFDYSSSAERSVANEIKCMIPWNSRAHYPQ